MCLQARLCPNTLGRLETVCEGPDTGVPPFSTAWEVRLSLQSEGERERETGLLLAFTFCSRKHGAGGRNGSARYRAGVTGERGIPLQGFGSHVLAPGQL